MKIYFNLSNNLVDSLLLLQYLKTIIQINNCILAIIPNKIEHRKVDSSFFAVNLHPLNALKHEKDDLFGSPISSI